MPSKLPMLKGGKNAELSDRIIIETTALAPREGKIGGGVGSKLERGHRLTALTVR